MHPSPWVSTEEKGVDHKALHGAIEPTAYLCAWNATGGAVTKAQHAARSFRVPAAYVSVQAVSLGSRAQNVSEPKIEGEPMRCDTTQC